MLRAGNSIFFANTSQVFSGIPTCFWDFGNGQTFTGCDPDPVTFSGAGPFTVSLRVCDDCGCDTLQKVLLLNQVDAPESASLQVYPNPATQFVQIEAPGTTIDAVSLYRVTGEKLAPATTRESGAWTLDVSTLPSGVYILEAILDGRATRMRLVVK